MESQFDDLETTTWRSGDLETTTRPSYMNIVPTRPFRPVYVAGLTAHWVRQPRPLRPPRCAPGGLLRPPGCDGLVSWGNGQLEVARSPFVLGEKLVVAGTWLEGETSWSNCSWETPSGEVSIMSR
jgi:hypothetical protein